MRSHWSEGGCAIITFLKNYSKMASEGKVTRAHHYTLIYYLTILADN